MATRDVKEERLHIRLTPDEKAVLEREAKRHGIPVSNVIRMLIGMVKRGEIKLTSKE